MARHPVLWSSGSRSTASGSPVELWPWFGGKVHVKRELDRPLGDRKRMTQPLQLSARGLVFDALAAGPPTGELVLLLHGFPQTCACWAPLLATLAAAGYRAVAPDQRGYSPGARPTTIQAYRMPELVTDVLALADRPAVRMTVNAMTAPLPHPSTPRLLEQAADAGLSIPALHVDGAPA